MNRVATDCRWIVILAVAVAAGCGHEATPTSTLATQDQRPFVLHSGMLGGSFLLGEDERVRWRFTDQQFVVESFQTPLPAHVVEPLFQRAITTYRVHGQWQLFDNGHTLLLTTIEADDGSQIEKVRLPLRPIQADEVIINSHTYRFAESLPLREILPLKIYRADVEEVIRGDLLRVTQADSVREVKLAGVACPPTRDALGERAAKFSQEFVAHTHVSVKVFGRDEQGREVAHVWAGLRFLNMTLLSEGLARHDKRHDNEWIFATAEDEACDHKRGLWNDEPGARPLLLLDQGIYRGDGYHDRAHD